MGRQSQLVRGHGIIPELRKRYEELSKKIIIRTLNKFEGNKQKTATALGLNRTTLVEWCRQHAPELINKG